MSVSLASTVLVRNTTPYGAIANLISRATAASARVRRHSGPMRTFHPPGSGSHDGQLLSCQKLRPAR